MHNLQRSFAVGLNRVIMRMPSQDHDSKCKQIFCCPRKQSSSAKPGMTKVVANQMLVKEMQSWANRARKGYGELMQTMNVLRRTLTILELIDMQGDGDGHSGRGRGPRCLLPLLSLLARRKGIALATSPKDVHP